MPTPKYIVNVKTGDGKTGTMSFDDDKNLSEAYEWLRDNYGQYGDVNVWRADAIDKNSDDALSDNDDYNIAARTKDGRTATATWKGSAIKGGARQWLDKTYGADAWEIEPTYTQVKPQFDEQNRIVGFGEAAPRQDASQTTNAYDEYDAWNREHKAELDEINRQIAAVTTQAQAQTPEYQNLLQRRQQLMSERDALNVKARKALEYQQELDRRKSELDAIPAVAEKAVADWEERNGAELDALTKLVKRGKKDVSEEELKQFGFADWDDMKDRYKALTKEYNGLQRAQLTDEHFLKGNEDLIWSLQNENNDIIGSKSRYEHRQLMGTADEMGVDWWVDKATGEDVTNDKKNYDLAQQYNEDSINTLKYTRKGTAGLMYELTNPDFFSQGLSELNKVGPFRSLYNRMAQLTREGKDFTDLSESEQALLKAIKNNADMHARMDPTRNWLFNAEKGAIDSIPFMVELGISGGLLDAAGMGRALTSKFEQNLTKFFTKKIGQKAESLLAQSLIKAASGIGSAVANTPIEVMMHPEQVMKATAENLLQLNENGELDPAAKAFWQGAVSTVFADGSERLGEATVNNLIFGSLAGIMKGILGDGKFFQNMAKVYASSRLDKFVRAIRVAGYDGIVAEWGEEVMESALNTWTGIDPDALRDELTGPRILETVASFVPTFFVGGTVNAMHVASANKTFLRTRDAFLASMDALNFSEDAKANTLSMFMGKTSNEKTAEQTAFSGLNAFINALNEKRIAEGRPPLTKKDAERIGKAKSDAELNDDEEVAARAAMQYYTSAIWKNMVDGKWDSQLDEKRIDRIDELEKQYGGAITLEGTDGKEEDDGKLSDSQKAKKRYDDGQRRLQDEHVVIVVDKGGRRYFVLKQPENGQVFVRPVEGSDHTATFINADSILLGKDEDGNAKTLEQTIADNTITLGEYVNQTLAFDESARHRTKGMKKREQDYNEEVASINKTLNDKQPTPVFQASDGTYVEVLGASPSDVTVNVYTDVELNEDGSVKRDNDGHVKGTLLPDNANQVKSSDWYMEMKYGDKAVTEANAEQKGEEIEDNEAAARDKARQTRENIEKIRAELRPGDSVVMEGEQYEVTAIDEKTGGFVLSDGNSYTAEQLYDKRAEIVPKKETSETKNKEEKKEEKPKPKKEVEELKKKDPLAWGHYAETAYTRATGKGLADAAKYVSAQYDREIKDLDKQIAKLEKDELDIPPEEIDKWGENLKALKDARKALVDAKSAYEANVAARAEAESKTSETKAETTQQTDTEGTAQTEETPTSETTETTETPTTETTEETPTETTEETPAETPTSETTETPKEETKETPKEQPKTESMEERSRKTLEENKKRRKTLGDHIEKLRKIFGGIIDIKVIDTIEELKAALKEAKMPYKAGDETRVYAFASGNRAWFYAPKMVADSKSDKAIVRLANRKFAHEVLGHIGMKQLIDQFAKNNNDAQFKSFNDFCSKVFDMMDEASRAYYLRYHWANNMSEKNRHDAAKAAGFDDADAKTISQTEWLLLTQTEQDAILDADRKAHEGTDVSTMEQAAADEYCAHLSERILNEGKLDEGEKSVWQKIVDAIKSFFHIEDGMFEKRTDDLENMVAEALNDSARRLAGKKEKGGWNRETKETPKGQAKSKSESEKSGKKVATYEKNPHISKKYVGWEKRDIKINTENYEQTDELRDLQESCQGGDYAIEYWRGRKEVVDGELWRRLAGVFRRQLDAAGSSGGFYDGVLNLKDPATGEQIPVKFRKNVSGKLFHDIFQVARQHLNCGDLVDLHEDYSDCICYITEDGLSGFAIEQDTGNAVSGFNLSPYRGFMRALSPYMRSQGATHGDCYASSKQNLIEIYQKVLGAKIVATVDYNMAYDEDGKGEFHGNPVVGFFVLPGEEISNDYEVRHFDKDGYDAARDYTLSLLKNESKTKESKSETETGQSESGTEQQPEGEAPSEGGAVSNLADDWDSLDDDGRFQLITKAGRKNFLGKTSSVKWSELSDEQRTALQEAARDNGNIIAESKARVEKENAGKKKRTGVIKGKKGTEEKVPTDEDIEKANDGRMSAEDEITEGTVLDDAEEEGNGGEVRFSVIIDEKKVPTVTKTGYKVFVIGKDGRLYPPMVNPTGRFTPVGVWLQAEVAETTGESKTGRPQVDSTKGGKLALRPGWHLGVIPYALQFNKKDKETGEKKALFPGTFVWAEVEYDAGKDYEEEAHNAGINKNGNFEHSKASLNHLPDGGYYLYRTNPDVRTDDWIITDKMKVNRILTDAEVDGLVKAAGREPQRREARKDETERQRQIDVLNEEVQKGEDYAKMTSKEFSEKYGNSRGYQGAWYEGYVPMEQFTKETGIPENTAWLMSDGAFRYLNEMVRHHLGDDLVNMARIRDKEAVKLYKNKKTPIKAKIDALANEYVALKSRLTNEEISDEDWRKESKALTDKAEWWFNYARNNGDVFGPEKGKSEWQVQNVVDQMRDNAQKEEKIPFNKANWDKEFGPNGQVKTALITVTLGDDQYLQVAQAKQGEHLGALKPTLEEPNLVVAVSKKPQNGRVPEREESHYYIRAFTDKNGNKHFFYTAVSNLINGMEKVTLNTEKAPGQVKRLIRDGEVLIKDEALFKESTSLKNNQPASDTQVRKSVSHNDMRVATYADNNTTPAGINSSDEGKDATNSSKLQETDENSSSYRASVDDSRVDAMSNAERLGTSLSPSELAGVSSGEAANKIAIKKATTNGQIPTFSPQDEIRFYMDAYRNAPDEVRKEIFDQAKVTDYDVAKAMARKLAVMAENSTIFGTKLSEADKTTLDNAVKAMASRLGISEDSAKYVLWNHANDSDDIVTRGMRTVMQDRCGLNTTESEDLARETREVYSTDVRMSADESAYRMYEDSFTVGGAFREQLQDEYLSLENLVEAVGKATGKGVASWENPMHAFNQLSSKNMADMGTYIRQFLEPLWRTVHDVCKNCNMSEAQLIEYMSLKHGLERNNVFARRDAEEEAAPKIESEERKRRKALEKELGRELTEEERAGCALTDEEKEEIIAPLYEANRKKDYSGITSWIGGKGDLASREDVARQKVDTYEKQMGGMQKELWQRVNAATQRTLQMEREKGLISAATYRKVSDMFDFYIPLQGFADKTNEDLYTYADERIRRGAVSITQGAKGRTSLADGPLGTIASQAQKAITVGNRNMAKIKLYTFLSTRRANDLVSMGDVWYEKTTDSHGNEITQVSYPEFKEGMTPEQMDEAIKAWQSRMEGLEEKGLAYRKRDGERIPGTVFDYPEKRDEHVIDVNVAGRAYRMFLKGNPRAAQAVNGQMPGKTVWGRDNFFLNGMRAITRSLSMVYTSLNPQFFATNLVRDLQFGTSNVFMKEGGEYAMRYARNLVNALSLVSYAGQYRNGTLDADAELARYYEEFASEGGITGYSLQKTPKEYEKMAKRYTYGKEHPLSPLSWSRRGIEALEQFTSNFENLPRFAAYITSRQMGRDIPESIANAKDVTVNFNRRGTGNFITWKEWKKLIPDSQTGNPLEKAAIAVARAEAVTASAILSAAAPMTAFFNVSVQGIAAMIRNAGEHGGRFAAVCGSYLMAGLAQGLLRGVLQGLMGGDGPDPEDPYWNIPEYVRRTNFIIPTGNGSYIKLAMPQELRAFYGMGDIIATQLAHKGNPAGSAFMDVLGGFSDVLPINPLGEGGFAQSVAPTFAVPVIDLVVNKDYKGAQIVPNYYDSPKPKWQMAYSGTPDWAIAISRGISKAFKGDEHVGGSMEVSPEAIQHIVEGYVGGLFTFANMMYKTAEQIASKDEDINLRNVPFANRFYVRGRDLTSQSYLNMMRKYGRETYEKVNTRYNAVKGSRDPKDREYMADLKSSEDWQVYRLYDKYRKKMTSANKKVYAAPNDEERRAARAVRDSLYADFARRLEAILYSKSE